MDNARLEVAKKMGADILINSKEVDAIAKDFLIATRLLSGGVIDVSELISAKVDFDHLNDAFEKAIDPSTYRIIVKCQE